MITTATSNTELNVIQSRVELLSQKIASHEAIVAVVGLGYVGLPFAVEKAKVGFQVFGLDENAVRAQQVNAAQNYISDVKNDDLQTVVQTGKLRAFTSFSQITDADIIVICVPTPLTKNLTPNLSYIESVTHEIAQHLRAGQLITLESTTYPGTTDEVMRPIL